MGDRSAAVGGRRDTWTPPERHGARTERHRCLPWRWKVAMCARLRSPHGLLAYAVRPFRWYLYDMSAATLAPPLGFDDMPVDEQIEYVQSLWDRIVGRSEDVPVPAWHRDEIDARIADHEASPDAGQPWEEVESELRAAR